ncbi:hypothetical protein ASNO1_37320 [Corallococcus caeni]|uniref:Uncharacterized protein n=1 Tax=Corallococcus caeni TaxID=3082388 RepID=A0ABQ6QTY4_9BACT|nr:hypothetical protein ASNO1_37320 [Corallococcus sp. NO1]
MPRFVGQPIELQLTCKGRDWHVDSHAARHPQAHVLFNDSARLTMQKALLEQDGKIAGEAHDAVICAPCLMELAQDYVGKQ